MSRCGLREECKKPKVSRRDRDGTLWACRCGAVWRLQVARVYGGGGQFQHKQYRWKRTGLETK